MEWFIIVVHRRVHHPHLMRIMKKERENKGDRENKEEWAKQKGPCRYAKAETVSYTYIFYTISQVCRNICNAHNTEHGIQPSEMHSHTIIAIIPDQRCRLC